MKKFGKILALLMMMTLVFAACTQAVQDNEVPASSGDEMEKEEMKDDMKEDDMAKDDMDDSSHDDGMKDDDMKDDDMKKDDMDDSSSMMNEGDAAPNFSLMNLDGETVSLGDFAGEKVYVKYWASWCSICLGGLSDLDELTATAEGYKVITIVTPDYKGEKSVEDFKEWFPSRQTENLVVLLDVDGEFAKEFGVRAMPTSAYIGSDGVLTKVLPGHIDNDQISAAFEDIY